MATSRQSSRERLSRTVQIDGHTVLRENNYVVRGGDYVFGDEEPDAPIAAPPQMDVPSTSTGESGSES